MPKIALITANLNEYERICFPVEQILNEGFSGDFYYYDDDNFPPRIKAMTPRLQSRILKMFGWQMHPDYDLYIWMDSSITFRHNRAVQAIWDLIEHHELLLYLHPHRKTVEEEYLYLRKAMEDGSKYFTHRYRYELLEDQMKEIGSNKSFIDDKLYMSTVVVYRATEKIKKMMKEWWYHTSRYHIIDQLQLPYVLSEIGCDVKELNSDAINDHFITTRIGLKF